MNGAGRIADNGALLDVLRELGPRTDALWLLGNVLGLGLTLAAALAFPRDGLFFAYLAVMIRFALYAYAGSAAGFLYFDRMLRLGVVAGLFEIFADYMLVHWLPTGALVYLTRDAVLLESPLYMPLAWACVTVEFGYVPVRLYGLLRQRRGALPLAMIGGGAVAGISIGLYEFFAFRAGWWKYEPARVMIGPYCAAYVPLGECLMFLGILPLFAAMLRSRDPKRAGPIVWGVLFAALILLSYAVSYVLLEVGNIWM